MQRRMNEWILRHPFGYGTAARRPRNGKDGPGALVTIKRGLEATPPWSDSTWEAVRRDPWQPIQAVKRD